MVHKLHRRTFLLGAACFGAGASPARADIPDAIRNAWNVCNLSQRRAAMWESA